jgi:hypothetical protein
MNRRFPSLERISTYAGPANLMEKTPEELRMLKERKLDLLYLGIETGNDELLKRVRKGATAEQIVDGSRKALQAGLRMSAFIILGLGGVNGSYRPPVPGNADPHGGPGRAGLRGEGHGRQVQAHRQETVPAGAPMVRRRP